MAEGEVAKIESVDLLREFRACLWKFAENASIALSDADSEVRATVTWLESDRLTYWRDQLRKREAAVVRAKEALRHKQLFKDPTGSRQSVVDEQRALAKAQRSWEEAEVKLKNVQKHTRNLQKEMLIYKGQTQRLSSAVEQDFPVAVATLDRILETLSQYLSIGVGPAEVASQADTDAHMARGSAEALAMVLPKYSLLRLRTPMEAARNTSTLAETPIGLGAIRQEERDRWIRKMGAIAERSSLPGGRWILMTGPVAEEAESYLQRTEPAFAEDSGWTLGPTDEVAATGNQLAALAQLVEAASGWEEILSLPIGFLVVLRGGRIVTILDENDNDLWS